MGMVIALLFISVAQVYFVIFSDWDKIIRLCINEGVLEEGNVHIDAHSVLPAMLSSNIV